MENSYMVFIIWMTGLPCSGKSTIAKKLREQIPGLEVLDGDQIGKWILPKQFSWTREERIENTIRIAHIVKLLFKHDISVCVSTITPYDESRKLIRKIIDDKRFVETYIKCSLQVCERRDIKGMYKKARTGEIKNFTGISAPYDVPTNPDLILDTENSTSEQCVENIQNYLKANDLIPPTI